MDGAKFCPNCGEKVKDIYINSGRKEEEYDPDKTVYVHPPERMQPTEEPEDRMRWQEYPQKIPPAQIKKDSQSSGYASGNSGNKSLFAILIVLLAVMFFIAFGAYAYIEGWIDFPSNGSQVTSSTLESESSETGSTG